jgi:WD40 repeat protein
MPRQARSILALCLLLESTAFADPPAAKVDRYGDPLPPGAIARLGTLRFRRTDAGDLRWVQFLPGDKEIFAAYKRGASFWDATTGREKRRLEHEGTWLALSSDGKCAACGAEGLVRVVDLVTGKQVRSFKAEVDEVPSAAFSPDCKMLAVGEEKQVALWELASGKLRTRLRGHHEGRVVTLSFSADGQRLASGCFRYKGCVWDVPSGKPWRKVDGNYVKLSPDGKRLFYSGGLKWFLSLGILALDANKPLPAPEIEVGGGAWGSFSPDGRILFLSVSGFGEPATSTTVWDVVAGKERLGLEGGFAGLSRDAKTVALRTDDHAFRLAEAATGKELRPEPGCGLHVSPVAFSPDGRTVATVGGPNVRIWRADTGEELRCFRKPHVEARLSFSSDGKQLAILDGVFSLDLLDASSGHRLGHWGRKPHEEKLSFHSDPKWQSPFEGLIRKEEVIAFNLSPEKPVALAVSDTTISERTIRFWDAARGKELRRLRLQPLKGENFPEGASHNAPCPPSVFSADGNLLVVAVDLEHGPAIGVWEAHTGKLLHSLAFNQEGQVVVGVTNLNLLISRDGDTLAAVTRSGDVRVWDLAAGSELSKWVCADAHYAPAALSPDGRWLACCGEKHSVLLYESATGKEAARWKGHNKEIRGIAFSPDGRRLATLSEDGTGIIWDLTSVPVPAKATATEGLWQALADGDAGRARQALLTLATRPDEVIELAGKRLRPTKRSELPDRVAALAARFDSKAAADRDRAAAELTKLGPEASPILRRILADKPSAEVRRRVEPVWQKLARNPSAEQLLAVRAVALLEMVGTQASRRLLEELASGAPEARLTQEAKTALRRVAEKDPPSEKMLFDFEDAMDLKAWSNLELPRPATKEPAARFVLSKENATSGKHSLKITFDGGEWPTLTTTNVPDDWNAYHTFKADVTVDRPCVVGFTALQEKSRRGGDWDGAVSRWTKTAILRPGKNEITGVLQPNEYSAINPKLGKVVRFEVFMYRPRKGESIFVDNIRLLTRKEPVPPPPSTRFKVLGTDLTIANVQELAKKLEKSWTPPKSRTVAEVEDEFRALYAELKKKHPRAILAVLRDGEKGYDPHQPDKVCAGWKDAYWSSHGPDGMTVERALNYGKHANHEVFMRHRSPLMRVDLSSIPRGAEVLAARLVIVRAGDRYDKERHPEKMPNLWVAEPCNRPWEEYEVNAYQYARDKFWKAVGGMYHGDDPDFLPLYLAHGPGGGKVNVWDFREAVKFWTDGKHANHGFMLHCDSRDYMRAHTREAKEIKDRPALLVIYDPK